ncbi:PAS domain S-box protein [Pedobacter rhodius]|uniref:histidine kinase n=1 Tax=Pedobacter rhodius TaxID=3004098 RepID=A0ABT4L0U5_9SPHI|nr:PAS domain S-box protein [Pedobacter sp. SJ11]MCZ4224799.1 PAS domain S-box protein [Pedobacter sp. SJ11]
MEVSLQQDFDHATLLMSKLLQVLTCPAIVLKISDSDISIACTNDQFVAWGTMVGFPTTEAFLAVFFMGEAGETLSDHVFRTQNTKESSSFAVSLGRQMFSGAEAIYSFENHYLSAQNNTTYLLQTIKMEGALLADEGLKSSIITNTDETFIIIDRDFIVVDFSVKTKIWIQEYLNLKLEKGKSVLNFLSKIDFPEFFKLYEKVVGGQTAHYPLEVESDTKHPNKISLTFKPSTSPKGQVEGIYISAGNVNEQSSMQAEPDIQQPGHTLIYENLSEAVFLLGVEEDSHFKFISINHAFTAGTGLTEAEVVNRYLEKVIPDPYLQPILEKCGQAVEQKDTVRWELSVSYPSGIKFLLISITPYCDQQESGTRIVGSVQDITQRVTIELQAKARAMTLAKILHSSPDIICTINEHGYFTGINAACERIWGYKPDFLKFRLARDFVPETNRPAFDNFLHDVKSGQPVTAFENSMLNFLGKPISMLWSANWDKEERQIYCTARENTAQKLAEAKLIQSEKRFRALVHDGSDMIAILDEAATYIYVSPSSKYVLDIEPESFIGRNAFEFIHPEDIEKTKLEFSSATGQKKLSLSPFRFRHNNGSWRWIQTIITDLRNSPAVGGFVANSRDVTDIMEAQNKVLISNERHRFVGKATSDAIWDWDILSGSIHWGEGFTTLFGYSQDFLNADIGIWKKHIHPLDSPRVEKGLDAFLSSDKSNWRDDYKYLKSDGTYAHVVDKGYVIRDAFGKAVRMIGAVQDITIRKAEEARLRVLESVVTNTVDSVLVAEVSPEGSLMTKISFINHAFEKLTGYTSEEVIGRSPWFLQGSGTDRSELKRLMTSIKNNRTYKGTIINYRKDGTPIWVNYSVTPVLDGSGSYAHWIAILRDVSQEKRTELQQNLLSEISFVFNSDLGFKETLKKVLVRISAYGQFAFSAIWTIDSNSGKLEPMAHYFADRAIKASADLRISDQLGKILAEQIKLSGKSAAWAEEESGVLIPAGIKSISDMPLFHHNRIVGVLLIGSMKIGNPKMADIPPVLDKHLGTELHRKQLERDLHHIFNVAPDIIAITDFDGNFRKLNPAASQLLGYSIEELLSSPFSHFLYPEDRRGNKKDLEKLRNSGKAYYIEERYLTAQGRTKWLAWTSQPLVKEKLIYSVAKDITEKKELEGLLLRSNSIARIGSWEFTFPDGKIYWSKIMREILHARESFQPDRDSFIGEPCSLEDKKRITQITSDCISSGEPWDEMLQIKTYTGDCKWVRTIGSAEFVDGKCIRIFGSLQDIDLQKRTEASATEARLALEESERRYSELFHLSPLPMWVYEFDTLKFLDVNQTAVDHYGYSRDEFLNMDISNIRPVEELDLLKQTLEKTRKDEDVVFQGIFKHKLKNGQIINVDIKSNTIIFKGKRAKIIVSTDITQRLKQFQAIELRNERLREIAWIQSHKVRAPLAKILGLVDLLSLQPALAPETQKFLQYIEQSANELDLVIKEVTQKSEELNLPGSGY